ncbi:MAG: MATE family efflux transporter [Ruminococcus flavefaciens]|nr:MATE family efflux transporter [Ruminococcus flavefaciens]
MPFSIIVVVVCGALLLTFANPIAGILGCSPEAAALVQHIISFLVWGYLLNAVTQCFMGRINGCGQPEKGMLITVLNHIVIRIPFSIILSHTALGLNGIWITLLFSFAAAFVCAYGIDRHVMKQK